MNSTCNNWKKVLLGGACASILSGIAIKVTQLRSGRKQSDTMNEVLLYGAGEEGKKRQMGLDNLLCVYYVLIHASKTIDVCMPSLESDTISKCLINVHQKSNISVRIIVHRNLDFNMKRFLGSGIDVRIISNAEVKLEHEFMLIDAVNNFDEALAIMGSLDYDIKRVNCDKDNTLLTADKAVIFTFKREFDRIWNTTVELEY